MEIYLYVIISGNIAGINLTCSQQVHKKKVSSVNINLLKDASRQHELKASITFFYKKHCTALQWNKNYNIMQNVLKWVFQEV